METSAVSTSRVTGSRVPGSIQGLGLGRITGAIIWSHKSKIPEEDLGTGKDEVLNWTRTSPVVPGSRTAARRASDQSRGDVYDVTDHKAD